MLIQKTDSFAPPQKRNKATFEDQDNLQFKYDFNECPFLLNDSHKPVLLFGTSWTSVGRPQVLFNSCDVRIARTVTEDPLPTVYHWLFSCNLVICVYLSLISVVQETAWESQKS